MNIITGTGSFGEKAVGVFNAIIERVGALGNKLIDLALDQIISGFFSNLMGGLGGMLGGGGYVPAFGAYGSFASGGYTGNTGINRPAGIVHGQEYVLSAAATRNIGVPTLNALNTGGAISVSGNSSSSAPVSMNFNISIDGARDAESLVSILENKLRSEMPQVVKRVMRDPRNMSVA